MPNTLTEALADGAHWVLAWVKHAAETTAAVWRWTTWPEVAVDGMLTVILWFNIWLLAVTERPLSAALLLTLWLVLTVSFVRCQVDRARERWQLEEELAAMPTGAPRIHDVRCQCGRRSRFVYDGARWVDTGARVLTRPSK